MFSTLSLFFVLSVQFGAVHRFGSAAPVFFLFAVREEFRGGESHLAEGGAGVCVAAGCAFLFGDAVVAARKHDLNGPFNAYHREHADCDIAVLDADVVNKISFKALTDIVGNRFDIQAAASERAAALNELDVEAYRLSGFDDNRGKSGLHLAADFLGLRAEAVVFGVGGENADVLLRAEEYDFLVKRRTSADFL